MVGDLDVLSGNAIQACNDYLTSRLGAGILVFRGVLSIVVRNILFAANNPNPKPWMGRVRLNCQRKPTATGIPVTQSTHRITEGESDIYLTQGPKAALVTMLRYCPMLSTSPEG